MTLENTSHYELASREIVTIRINPGGTTISVTDNRDNQIGTIELDSREDPRGGVEFFLVRMYLDLKGEQYKRRGIGRAALTFHHEMFDSPIYAQSDDGLTRDDGSHLTQDAPAFVAAMRRDGLIEPDCTYEDSDESLDED